jgi:hypothetical protein
MPRNRGKRSTKTPTRGLGASDNTEFFLAVERLITKGEADSPTSAILKLIATPKWSKYAGERKAVPENRAKTLLRYYRRWVAAERPSAPQSEITRVMGSTRTSLRSLAEALVLPLPPGFLSRAQAIEKILHRLYCSVGMAEATLRKALDSGEVRMRVPNVRGRLISIRRKNAHEFEVIIRHKGHLIPGTHETTEIVEERDIKISDEDLTDWLNRFVVSNNGLMKNLVLMKNAVIDDGEY